MKKITNKFEYKKATITFETIYSKSLSEFVDKWFNFYIKRDIAQKKQPLEKISKDIDLPIEKFSKEIFNIFIEHRPNVLLSNKKFLIEINNDRTITIELGKSNSKECYFCCPKQFFVEIAYKIMKKSKRSKKFEADFVHEVDHYLDTKIWKAFEQFETIVQKFPSTTYKTILYLNLLNMMRAECYTLLRDTANKTIDINVTSFREFTIDINKFVRLKGEDDKITHTAGAIYKKCEIHDVGFAMGIIICLSYLKLKSKLQNVKLLFNEKIYEVEKIDYLFRKFDTDDTLQISGISKHILYSISDEIKNMNYAQLIKAYEQACKRLGIRKRNMFIWKKRHHHLFKKTLKN
jgi:hypothetical protein